MREIKFRAWDTYNLKMIESFTMAHLLNCYNNEYSPTQRDDISNFNFINGKKEIVMQYTGLKDKNGKEIYEGDRMTKLYGELARGDIYECVFHNGAFGYFPILYSKENNFIPFANSVNWHSFEVIGNIYETVQ